MGEANSLGFGEPIALSAEHGEGMADLYQAVLVHEPIEDDEADARLRSARREKKVSALLHAGYPVRYWDHDLGMERTRLRLASAGGDGDVRLDDLRELSGDVGPRLGQAAMSRDGSVIVSRKAEGGTPTAMPTSTASVCAIQMCSR